MTEAGVDRMTIRDRLLRFIALAIAVGVAVVTMSKYISEVWK